ncbi:MAG: FecR family protein, partial [Bacteroidetes bacterium]|nr:FecR family protein [Bacteroidota bacterium]
MEKEYLIQKWLNNDLTDSENEAFVQREDYQLNIDILEYAESFKASNFYKIDDFDTFKQCYNSQNKLVKKLYWLTPMLRIASVIVISFGMYLTFFYNNLTQIQTLSNQKTTI